MIRLLQLSQGLVLIPHRRPAFLLTAYEMTIFPEERAIIKKDDGRRRSDRLVFAIHRELNRVRTVGVYTVAMRLQLFITGLALLWAVQPVSADSLAIWLGPSGGNWSNPANWDPGIVPNGAVSATIQDAIYLQLDTSVTLDNLTLKQGWLTVNSGQTLQFNPNGALSILPDKSGYGSNLNIQGTVNLTGAGDTLTVAPNGPVDIYSDESNILVIQNGTLTIGTGASLTNYNSATGTLTGGSFAIQSGTLQLAGADLVNNDSVLVLGGSARFIDQNGANALRDFADNQSGATLNIVDGESFTDNTAFTNSGALYLDPTSTFSGAGSFTQSSGSTEVDGKLSESGGVVLNGGQFLGLGTIASLVTNNSAVFEPGSLFDALSLAPGATSVGGYSQAAGGTLQIGMNGLSYSSVDVTGSGADNVNLAGLLDITFGSALPPQGVYTILADPSGTIAGNVNSVECPSLPGQSIVCTDSISADGHSVLLTITGTAPEPFTWALVGLGVAVLCSVNVRRPRQLARRTSA